MPDTIAGPSTTAQSWRARFDWWERRVVLVLVLAGLWALGGTGPAIVVGITLGWALRSVWPST